MSVGLQTAGDDLRDLIDDRAIAPVYQPVVSLADRDRELVTRAAASMMARIAAA